MACGPDRLSAVIVCASACLRTHTQHTLACAYTACLGTGARRLETVYPYARSLGWRVPHSCVPCTPRRVAQALTVFKAVCSVVLIIATVVFLPASHAPAVGQRRWTAREPSTRRGTALCAAAGADLPASAQPPQGTPRTQHRRKKGVSFTFSSCRGPSTGSLSPRAAASLKSPPPFHTWLTPLTLQPVF